MRWVTRSLVFVVHDAQLAEHGGSPGVRDLGLLDSALARPQNAAAYGDPDICELAGLYALGIIKNHPFIDGNKRVGYVIMLTFLELNGRIVTANAVEKFQTIYDVAAGTIDDETFFTWIREHSEPR